jgi:hypothetical protein
VWPNDGDDCGRLVIRNGHWLSPNAHNDVRPAVDLLSGEIESNFPEVALATGRRVRLTQTMNMLNLAPTLQEIHPGRRSWACRSAMLESKARFNICRSSAVTLL